MQLQKCVSKLTQGMKRLKIVITVLGIALLLAFALLIPLLLHLRW